MGEVSERSLASEKVPILELLPHKLDKVYSKNFKRLLPKEFDAALLEKLVKEGRVYVNVPKVSDKDAYMREILDYVKSIRKYAAAEWSGRIDEVWQKLVHIEGLADFLTMKRGLQAGHMNRYAVMNLICRMQSFGIYRKDVTTLKFNQELEGTTQRSRYYTSYGNYAPDKEARGVLREFFKSIR